MVVNEQPTMTWPWFMLEKEINLFTEQAILNDFLLDACGRVLLMPSKTPSPKVFIYPQTGPSQIQKGLSD